MAVVIREGGSSPFKPENADEMVALFLLEFIHDKGFDTQNPCDYAQAYVRAPARSPSIHDTQKALVWLYSKGWIEPSAYKCSCCDNKVFGAEEILEHATRFRLTAAGREKIPEHIFP